jgi:hypothetical protein
MTRLKGKDKKLVKVIGEEEKKSEYSGREFWDAKQSYIDALHAEVNLYRSEIRRALERYKETREPIFCVNGEIVSAENLPLRIYQIMLEEKHVGIRTRTLVDAKDLKKSIFEVEYYLRSLPEARMPARPEIIDKWLKSNE